MIFTMHYFNNNNNNVPKNKSILLLFIHYISEINGTVMAWRDWGKMSVFVILQQNESISLRICKQDIKNILTGKFLY